MTETFERVGYRPDHYYLHDEMEAFLRRVADRFPDNFSLDSVGRSPEGRGIWVMTVTAADSIPAEDRPAYWIDANTHASEVTGNAAALYAIAYLAEHIDDPAVVSLLQDVTLYIAPRLNPDGAEYCLTHNHYVRSARRPYPDPEPTPGLVEQDLDGDGHVLQMRIEAEDGAWRVSDEDPRLLVPRMPWDDGEGPFYHLYAEGLFEEDSIRDPRRPMKQRDPHGLDFNRNYPYRWQPEAEQPGAGPYPLSEPETRAAVDFLLSHPNVCGIMSYHTYTGVLLRPYTDRPDTEMPAFDLASFELLGKRCEELTGYPCKSTYHDFRYDPVTTVSGVFDDWAYDQYGVHAFTMELWDPQNKAGIEPKERLLDHWQKPTEEDQIRYLKWNDEELDGEGFEPWRPFDHPQLGPVEIGGWKFLYTLRNPPTKYLAKVCHDATLFALDHARACPRPSLSVDARELAPGLWRVTATMKNDGFLPTYVTMRGKKIVNDLHLELELGEGMELEDGKLRERVPHLEGLSASTVPNYGAHAHSGRTRDTLDVRTWVVEGSGEARIVWRGDRIGRHEATVTL